MTFVVEPHPQTTIDVVTGGQFPVRRILCIGRNYGDHVKEMGGDAKSDPPVFFSKPADAIVANGETIPFPPATNDLHYEGELVVALGQGGRNLSSREEAGALIFANACGCDLTRRDLQALSKNSGTPWDMAKGFDNSAPIAPLAPITDITPSQFDDARLRTRVNGDIKQDAPLSEMIWSVPEILIELSQLIELKAGDIIFTGTPAGVGPLLPGDKVEVSIGLLPSLSFTMGEKE